MPRFFNVTGPCDPRRSFMLPPLVRLPELGQLIAEESYFILHAPRQVGKTTAMIALAEQLRGQGYLALHVSLLEARGIPEVERAENLWLTIIQRQARFGLPDEQQPPPLAAVADSAPGARLADWLSAWCRAVKLPFVLLLDEADSAQGEAMASLLAQLRSGFEHRGVGRFPTSVGLIGLRNLRDYIIEVRGRPFSQSSPFNNAISLTLRNFIRAEVTELYQQHTDDTGQVFQAEAVDAVMYWTDGQPWLVNAMARYATNKLVPNRASPVLPEHIEQAKEALILERATHLDNLAERLKEERVARVIAPILVGEGTIPDGTDDFQYCIDLGLIRRTPIIQIANPLYREVLARQLTAELQASLPDLRDRWHTPEGRLDLPALIQAFRAWWREHADILDEGDGLYREATPHLVFMAFLQRIVNGSEGPVDPLTGGRGAGAPVTEGHAHPGGGRITREYAAGRGRMDLLIEYRGGRHVVEIKRAKTDAAMVRAKREGEEQLLEYLNATGVDEGWLLLFDLRAGRSWDEKLWDEERSIQGKTLHFRGA